MDKLIAVLEDIERAIIGLTRAVEAVQTDEYGSPAIRTVGDIELDDELLDEVRRLNDSIEAVQGRRNGETFVHIRGAVDTY